MQSETSVMQDAPDRPVTVETVVTEYETPLLRYASRILSNHAAAQDVVQNVFIKLVRAWEDGTRPSVHLKSWLYRVTHNEAVDHIRQESKRSLLHIEQSEDPALGSTEEEKKPDDRMALVLKQLHTLHPRERQIVLLRLEEGLSYTEISAITGRTEGNVGNILHHAIRKLAVGVKTKARL